MKWSSARVRELFILFFKEKGHVFVPASPIVPDNDPTLMFINAGMNQFKDVFLGQGKRSYTRAVNSQLCVRVSGKHNDLEDVGRDTTHLTSFEMLGNWSFGDYYKRDAIVWAWELFTQVYKINKHHLFVTVYQEDDEAYDLWLNETDVDPTHIIRCDEKDNFWEMGETGPCGPCSEIHVDLTPGVSLDNSSLLLTQSDLDSDRFIELWNLVFIQYNRQPGGKLDLLPEKHVDTGAGLERLTAYLQGTSSTYETDLFKPIIRHIEIITQVPYLDNIEGMPHRVIADHIRTISIGIADNIMPSNEGRGYVLRRLLRRALRYAQVLNYKKPMLYQLVPSVIQVMGAHFEHLKSRESIIQKIVKSEEESFLTTLEEGLQRVDTLVSKLKSQGNTVIPGKDAFKLYDTYGFPVDLTQVLAQENQLEVDMKGFEFCLSKQKTRSRNATKEKQHDALQQTSVTVDNKMFDSLPLHLSLYTDKARGGEARLISDPVEKLEMARHHSATHLLHEALRQLLGDHVQQAGSLVDTNRLRFDFTHFESISKDQLDQVERWINRQIQLGISITTEWMNLDAAKEKGAMALFGEKYDSDNVRVVSMGTTSIELCGGTHVNNTALIEQFKIVSESAISSGTRRIEAIVGFELVGHYHRQQQADWQKKISVKRQKYDQLVDRIQSFSEVPVEQLAHHDLSLLPVDELIEEHESYTKGIKRLEKQLSQLKAQGTGNELDQLDSLIESIMDFKLVAVDLPSYDIKMLRGLSDVLINKHPNLIMLLGGRSGDVGGFVVRLPQSAIELVGSAGDISQKVGSIAGGKGGGRPDFASGGGADPALLSNALAQVKQQLMMQLESVKSS